MTEDVLGNAAWTQRTGGRLSASERRSLMGPLARTFVDTTVGMTRWAVGAHPGRRAVVDPAALTPPDSKLATDARDAARELLSPTLLHHSQRSYAFGAAIAALEEVPFDRELLYVSAMMHDTGLSEPTAGIDFTVRSATHAGEFCDRHEVGAAQHKRIADAICLHHTPGITREHGAEAYLLSAGAGVDVFGLRSWELPGDVRRGLVREFPRSGFKREFTRLWRNEARSVPASRAWMLRRYGLTDLTIRLTPFRG